MPFEGGPPAWHSLQVNVSLVTAGPAPAYCTNGNGPCITPVVANPSRRLRASSDTGVYVTTVFYANVPEDLPAIAALVKARAKTIQAMGH